MLTTLLAAAALAGALAYLREPSWLADVESGFRTWESLPDGTRYRWIAGHASFFVPANASSVSIPVRTTFDAPDDPPVLISIAIDDRLADELVLRDDQWLVRKIRMPAPGERGLRRIDLRVDRLRPGHRGAQIGEIIVMR
jgi:hypothetical protein